ncbi:iron export ABC transporter permease subunit FetB [Bacillaceae bacterium]
MKDIGFFALLVTVAFMMVPVLISCVQRLGLAKDVLISSLRGFVQLMLLGYALTFLFAVETWYILSFLILLMITVAARNAAKRGKSFRHAKRVAFYSILGAESLTLLLWLAFEVIEFKGQYVLPMSGMVIGNSMVVASLTFERMLNEFEQTKGLILAKLALGANMRQACQDLIQNTVKAAMIPTVDLMKTVGIVQLPGMMTGAIIAGASPIIAVKYQIVIMFSLMAAAAITGILVSFQLYPAFIKQKMF